VGSDLAFHALRERAVARKLTIADPLTATVIASLKIGKHLLIAGPSPDSAEMVAELIADTAADSGVAYGTVTITSRTASLLSLSDLLAPSFREDFWIVLRRAEPVGLRRIIDQISDGRGPRLIAATAMCPRALVAPLSPAGRRALALVDLTSTE
jgi:hypothetical protein